MEFIGRRIAVGVGAEVTRGTPVEAQYWQKHLNLTFQNMSESVNNESAIGVVEQINDSTIARLWAEGQIDGKVTDETIGLFLHGAFGDVVSVETADTGVYDHTFNILQSNVPPTLTISRKDPVADKWYARGVVGNLTFNNTVGEYVQFTASMFSQQGQATTTTPVYTKENEFTSKDVTVKIADTEAGLAGASSIPVSAFSSVIEKNAEPYFSMGDDNPTEITSGSVNLSGEFTLRYTSEEYENMYFNADKKWLEIEIKNNNVTIGASSSPSIVFRFSQAVLSDWSLAQGLDDIVEQTIGFTSQYNTDEAYAIRAILTNTVTNYI